MKTIAGFFTEVTPGSFGAGVFAQPEKIAVKISASTTFDRNFHGKWCIKIPFNLFIQYTNNRGERQNSRAGGPASIS
jgi:hypothetical protein